MKRQIDKTKKSNIKCEHCRYADVNEQRDYWCSLHETPKNYWNRCKEFEWKDGLNYADSN